MTLNQTSSVEGLPDRTEVVIDGQVIKFWRQPTRLGADIVFFTLSNHGVEIEITVFPEFVPAIVETLKSLSPMNEVRVIGFKISWGKRASIDCRKLSVMKQ